MRFKIFFHRTYRWIYQIFDPIRLIYGIVGYFWFVADILSYRKLDKHGTMLIRDMQPELHDRHSEHEFEAHYFYLNAWAMRRIVASRPERHVDIGSMTVFPSMLSAIVPVDYIDYRALNAKLANLKCVSGDILHLPYDSGSIKSLSCLHVAEHIGLGRYGDPLDPAGTIKAIDELNRVLAPGGLLFFAVPVGKPRLCFNAHRIHSSEKICEYFAGFKLLEHSGVHDDGRFVERVDLNEFNDSEYACGMFVFRAN